MMFATAVCLGGWEDRRGSISH